MNSNEQAHHNPLIQPDAMRMSFADFAEIHGKKIIGIAVPLVLLIAVYLTTSKISRNAIEEESKRWSDLGMLQQSADLQAFAKNNSGTPQASIAKVEAARVLLAQGLTLFASSNAEMKKEASNNIEKAIELYDDVIKDPLLNPELKAQALLNTGKAHESLRHFDKAKDYYTQASLLKDNTAAGKLAAKYLGENQVEFASFYKNFD